MAKDMAAPGGLGPISQAVLEPSIRNALLYFMSLAVFPLVVNAAVQGGWWIAAPMVFFMLPDWFDVMFGTEERNMDLAKTLERQLFWYKLAVWLWAVLWPATLGFTLWQILVTGHLSTLEGLLMALVLGSVAQPSFIVGHELIHQRSVPERRLGEFILACASYPHYATEHIIFTTPWPARPGTPGPRPRG